MSGLGQGSIVANGSDVRRVACVPKNYSRTVRAHALMSLCLGLLSGCWVLRFNVHDTQEERRPLDVVMSFLLVLQR